jgi:hypothetical protein
MDLSQNAVMMRKYLKKRLHVFDLLNVVGVMSEKEKR